jgi:hypothetical protein
MSDWYCKIGERKIGPLNGQQLKTVVAKGQLKPDHLVRRGSEGPWVPAGRIKGLFAESLAGDPQSPAQKLPKATAKPLGQAAARLPKAKATNLPAAAEAPVPPAAEIPEEFSLGGRDKHSAQMNIDDLDYETAPLPVSRRKVKSGMKALKTEEQKKVKVLLISLIGGGMTIAIGLMIWAIATGQFSGKPEVAKDPMAPVEPANSGVKAKDSTEKKSTSPPQEPEIWKIANVEETQVGTVIVKVLNPKLGPPPKGAKTAEGEVLIVTVNLQLKQGESKAVDLTSWADPSLRKKVSLTDDQKGSYELLDQVAVGGDGRTITPTRIQVLLIFQAPTNPKVSLLKLKLPPAAFHVQGPMICYNIKASEIKQTQPGKSGNSDEAESGGAASKSGKK